MNWKQLLTLVKKKGMKCLAEIYPMFSVGRAKERNDLLLNTKRLIIPQQCQRILLAVYTKYCRAQWRGVNLKGLLFLKINKEKSY